MNSYYPTTIFNENNLIDNQEPAGFCSSNKIPIFLRATGLSLLVLNLQEKQKGFFLIWCIFDTTNISK